DIATAINRVAKNHQMAAAVIPAAGGVDDAEFAQRLVEECGIAFEVTEHRYPAGHLRHGGRYAGVIQREGMPPARAVDLQLVAAPARLPDIVLAEPRGRPRVVAVAPDDRPVE